MVIKREFWDLYTLVLRAYSGSALGKSLLAGLGGPYGVLRIQPGLTAWKASALPIVLVLSLRNVSF